MIEFFVKIWNWFKTFWENQVFNFIKENSDNPFFWISILLVGIIITKLAYEALNKDNGGL